MIISGGGPVKTVNGVRKTLQEFYDGYQKRDIENVDKFMELFSLSEDIEMLGISATEPGAYEWFKGREDIEEIIVSDWTYWGDVDFTVENAHIVLNGNTAWFTTYGELKQNSDNSDSMPFFKKQMLELLDSDKSDADQMFEAVHFGIRRLLEKNRGVGAAYKLVITGVLVLEDEKWRLQMLHWSMPVD